MDLRKKVIWLLLFFAFSKIILADNTPELANKWINYTDLKNVVSISVDKKSPIGYCATTGGLFVVDLSQKTVLKKFTNIDGLLSNNLTSIYVDTLDRLWIGASDGSIAILDYNANSFRYIYDIKNSNENNKSINDFVQHGGNMFVATGYGIQKISISNFNFLDAPYYTLGNYPAKSKVLTISVYSGKLFAGTAAGIAFALVNSNNLNNPASWSNYNTDPFNANVKSSEVLIDKIVFGSETGFGYYDNANWFINPNPVTINKNIKDIKKQGEFLYYIATNTIYFSPANNLATATQYATPGSYLSLGEDAYSGKPLAGVFENGLMMQNGNGAFDFIYPDCPYRISFDNISIGADGVLWAAGGNGDAGFYRV